MSNLNKKAPAFLLKTYKMLENSEYAQTIHWNESGNGFVIADQNNLTQTILPKYFKHQNMASYIRQLNMYGFSKKREKDHNYYHHRFFIKNKPELIKEIQRKVENKGPKTIKGSATSLDFHSAEQQPCKALLRINYLLLLQQGANLQLMIKDLQQFPECQELKDATYEYMNLHNEIIKNCKSNEEKHVQTTSTLVEKEPVEQYEQQK